MLLNNVTSHFTLPALDLVRPELAARDVLSGLVLATFALLMVVEIRVGRGIRHNRTARVSYRANLATFLFNDIATSLLSVSSLLAIADRYADHGVLAGVESPWLQGLVGFVLLDLTLYFWHWANHRFPWLWMFHKVHHSDRSMNVTTAFRLHVVEIFLTMAVKALFVVVTGVSSALVVVNEAIITLFVMFHHLDISFHGERLVGRLFVVPRLHRAHHSAWRAEHDRNYGAVFSLWDRLFGTLIEIEPAQVGLHHVPAQGFLELLKFGFVYAYLPNQQTLRAMIAEAAYFRAEKRGFVPGFELFDWLEAEREVTEAMGRF
jgi:sterol desaturase/sphingolipid hydroxylase (fatty acid hydroxylase superfamily)